MPALVLNQLPERVITRGLNLGVRANRGEHRTNRPMSVIRHLHSGFRGRRQDPSQCSVKHPSGVPEKQKQPANLYRLRRATARA